VAKSCPWFLTLAAATHDAKLSAHFKIKRRLDFTSSSREIADSLANNDATASLLMQNCAQASAHPAMKATMDRAMEAFVASKCPALKYKELLLPELGGGLDRARRHFGELKLSPEPLVAALASERDFLCEFIERQYTPVQKRGDRGKCATVNDVPEHALVMLRFMMKSLSVRLKKAAARDEPALMLVRAWYVDHMIFAETHMQEHLGSKRKQETSSAAPWFTGGPVKATRLAQPVTNSSGHRNAQVVVKEEFSDVEGKNGGEARVPEAIARYLKDGLRGREAGQAFKDAQEVNRGATLQFFGVFCKNCFLAGKGLVHHRLKDCQAAGNRCVVPCAKCPGQQHWAENCPKK
jgi:hypothetical protein